jgi:hypothetical protein
MVCGVKGKEGIDIVTVSSSAKTSLCINPPGKILKFKMQGFPVSRATIKSLNLEPKDFGKVARRICLTNEGETDGGRGSSDKSWKIPDI